MKKIIVILTVFVLASSTSVSAQTTHAAAASSTVSISFMFLPTIYIDFGDIKGEIATSTVQVPEGRGTIKLNKRADKFIDAVFTDAAGKSVKLLAVTSFSSNAPKPICKSGETTGLYASAEGDIQMSICKALPLADGSKPLIVSLVLPAVQAAREAGRSSN